MSVQDYPNIDQREYQLDGLNSAMSRAMRITNAWLASQKSQAKTLDIETLHMAVVMLQRLAAIRATVDQLIRPNYDPRLLREQIDAAPSPHSLKPGPMPTTAPLDDLRPVSAAASRNPSVSRTVSSPSVRRPDPQLSAAASIIDSVERDIAAASAPRGGGQPAPARTASPAATAAPAQTASPPSKSSQPVRPASVVKKRRR